MPTIRIVLDTPLITKDETRILRQAAQQYVTPFLPYWLLGSIKFEVSTVIGAPGTWNFYLTENSNMSYETIGSRADIHVPLRVRLKDFTGYQQILMEIVARHSS